MGVFTRGRALHDGTQIGPNRRQYRIPVQRAVNSGKKRLSIVLKYFPRNGALPALIQQNGNGRRAGPEYRRLNQAVPIRREFKAHQIDVDRTAGQRLPLLESQLVLVRVQN